MAIFNEFPQTNFHELNLDWIIAEIKKLSDEWENFQPAIEDYVAKWLAEHPEVTTSVQDNSITANKLVASLRDRILTDYAKESDFNALSETVGSLNIRTGNNEQNITVLASRMDEFASLPDGSTSGDAELLDIRVGSNGYTYNSAGDAVRAQFNNVNDALNSSVCEKIPTTLIPNSYVNRDTGAIVPYNGWSRTDYIEIDCTRNIHIKTNGVSNYCACYDQNRAFIRAFSITNLDDIYAFQHQTKYIIISGVDSIFPVSLDYPIGVFTENKLDNVINKVKPSGIMPLTGWKVGTLTQGAPAFSWTRLFSPLVDINSNETYNIKFHKNDFSFYIVEYSANQVYIRTTPIYSEDAFYTSGQDAEYIRFVAMTYPTADGFMYPSDALDLGIEVVKAGQTELKVMTYNIGHYDYGIDFGLDPDIYDEKLLNYRKVVADLDCDIIGFQEFDTRMDRDNTIWADDVLWDYYYPYKINTGSAAAIKTSKIMTGQGFAQLSTGRYYTYGYVEGVFCMSVHLSVGAENMQLRQQEVTEILSILSAHDTFILFGDFNPQPGEEDAIYGRFTNVGYKIANCDWFGNMWTWSSNRDDFNHYDSPTGTLWYVDNIIVSDNIKIKNAYPVNVYNKLSSDHIPLIAELSVNR